MLGFFGFLLLFLLVFLITIVLGVVVMGMKVYYKLFGVKPGPQSSKESNQEEPSSARRSSSQPHQKLIGSDEGEYVEFEEIEE